MAGLYVTGIAGSGTGQYFIDQNSNPILLKCDTVWALPQMAGSAGGSVTYQTDMSNYCSTRASQGFNAFLITAVGDTVSSQGGGPNNGNTWDGVAPFTSPGVLNNTYWTRVDYLMTQAQNNGLTVVFNVAYQYSMDMAGVAFTTSWTDANYTAYGTAIGNRYKSYPNILWTCADDYFGSFDNFFTDVKTAIQATGDTHLWSIENYAESTSRFDTFNNTVLPWGTSNAQYSYCYSYGESYLSIEYAYKESSPIVVIHGDGYYDTDAGGTEAAFLRNWAWWIFSSGARGMIYGREAIWPWATSSLASLTTGLFDKSVLQTIFTAFTSLPGWNKLVPDTSSALVTAGRGTRATQIVSGGSGTEYLASSTQNTYVTASITPGGTLAVIYIPSNVTITVNGSLMQAGYTASWMDPATGTKTAATIASTYNHSGANSAGGADWVLVLQAPTAQQGISTLSGTGTITANIIEKPVITLSVSGTVAAVARILSSSVLSSSGSVTNRVIQRAVATLTSTGNNIALGVQSSISSSTGTGTVAATTIQNAVTTSSGTGTVTARAILSGILVETAAGNLIASVVQTAGATLSGTSNITATASTVSTAAGVSTLSSAGSTSAIVVLGSVSNVSASDSLAVIAAILSQANISSTSNISAVAAIVSSAVDSGNANLTVNATVSSNVAASGIGNITANTTITPSVVASGTAAITAIPTIASGTIIMTDIGNVSAKFTLLSASTSSGVGNAAGSAAILSSVSSSGTANVSANALTIAAATATINTNGNITARAVIVTGTVVAGSGVLSATVAAVTPGIAVITGNGSATAASCTVSNAQLGGNSALSASASVTTGVISGTTTMSGSSAATVHLALISHTSLHGFSSVTTTHPFYEVISMLILEWRFRRRPIKDRLLTSERWISTDDGGAVTQALPTIPAQDPIVFQPPAPARRRLGIAQIVPR